MLKKCKCDTHLPHTARSLCTSSESRAAADAAPAANVIPGVAAQIPSPFHATKINVENR